MENLHSDILENILSRLPIEVALHAKEVSETWREILRYKTDKKTGFLFAHGHGYKLELFYEDEYDHYDHAKMNCHHSCNTLTKIEHGIFTKKCISTEIMVGSCNGLVCFDKSNEDVPGADPLFLICDPLTGKSFFPLFLICNPLTGESVFLPGYSYSELPIDKSKTDKSSTSLIPYGDLTSGFGYCPSTNDYKVVTIYYFHGENKGHVQVYTVGGEWRYIGYISRYDNFDTSSPGIYANGSLYWMQEKVNHEILAFDLEREEFHYITLPSCIDFKYRSYLMLLGGNNNLYLVHTSSPIDIWVYKRNERTSGTSYAMKECKSPSCPNKELSIQLDEQRIWTKEFCIRLQPDQLFIYTNTFAVTRGNEVLLWCVEPKGRKRLCRYDPKTSTLNKLWDGFEKIDQAIPHTQSIVSLKDLGETNLTSLKDIEKSV